jgi:hypothetical protein
MDHTYIVRANHLEEYADTRESEGVIPQLLPQPISMMAIRI